MVWVAAAAAAHKVARQPTVRKPPTPLPSSTSRASTSSSSSSSRTTSPTKTSSSCSLCTVPSTAVLIPRDKQTGSVKGYAFVCMINYKDAVNAIRYLNGHPVGNKRLKVSFKEQKGNDGAGGAAGGGIGVGVGVEGQ